MKQQFVIETDSDHGYVAVYPVDKSYTDKVVYQREAGDSILVYAELGPKFYGKLDALLVTANKIENAAPIEPEVTA